MNKQILVLLAVTAIAATSCVIDERLHEARLKSGTTSQRYNYASSALKGVATAALHTTWTAGGYSIVAGIKFGSLLVKKLTAKNRPQHEQHEELKQLIHHGSQTVVSTALALALWGVFGQNKITKARDAVLQRINPFGVSIEQGWVLLNRSEGSMIPYKNASLQSKQHVDLSSQSKSLTMPIHLVNKSVDYQSGSSLVVPLNQKEAEKEQAGQAKPAGMRMRDFDGQEHVIHDNDKAGRNQPSLDQDEFDQLLKASPEQLQEVLLENAKQLVSDPNVPWLLKVAAQQMINDPSMLAQEAHEAYSNLQTNPDGLRSAIGLGSPMASGHRQQPSDIPSEDEVARAFIAAQDEFRKNRSAESKKDAAVKKKEPVGPPAFPIAQDVLTSVCADQAPTYEYVYNPSHEWNNITRPYVELKSTEGQRVKVDALEPKRVECENKTATIASCDDE